MHRQRQPQRHSSSMQMRCQLQMHVDLLLCIRTCALQLLVYSCSM
jgi:hypothetical protein